MLSQNAHIDRTREKTIQFNLMGSHICGIYREIGHLLIAQCLLAVHCIALYLVGQQQCHFSHHATFLNIKLHQIQFSFISIDKLSFCFNERTHLWLKNGFECQQWVGWSVVCLFVCSYVCEYV